MWAPVYSIAPRIPPALERRKVAISRCPDGVWRGVWRGFGEGLEVGLEVFGILSHFRAILRPSCARRVREEAWIEEAVEL